MIWIDFGLLWYVAYRLCSVLGEIVFKWERLALSFLFALGLKSLILFFLIRSGIQPVAGIQIGVSGLALGSTLFLPVKSNWGKAIPSGKSAWLTLVTCIVIGALFLFSMVNAWVFPITESDATWYHIKGMSFFHEVRLDSEWVVPQLRQYPPFIPLLFAYLISFDFGFFSLYFFG